MTEATVQHFLKEEKKIEKPAGRGFFIKTFLEPETGTNNLHLHLHFYENPSG